MGTGATLRGQGTAKMMSTLLDWVKTDTCVDMNQQEMWAGTVRIYVGRIGVGFAL
jgi:hypothetical protein